MTRLAAPALLSAALVLAAPPAQAADVCALPRAHAEMGIEVLSWLAGNWIEKRGDVVIREHWVGPYGDTLLGTGITSKGAATKSYEFFRLARTADGVSYFASPNAAPPTEFKAIEICSDKVVFENKAHDFPQRVIYVRGANKTLDARIEGMVKGKLEGEDFHYRRE